MGELNDLRVDSRGLLISVGDLCLVLHKGQDDDILLTSGFYEGENDPPKKNDFAVSPISSMVIGKYPKFKGAYVFRLHSMFEEYQLARFTLLGEAAVKAYKKNKRITNGKRLIVALSELVESPDLPFEPIASLEFEDKEEEEDEDLD